MLMTFARYWPWIVKEEPRRDAGLRFLADRFSYIWSTQITSLTENIQLSLLRGVEKLIGNRPRHRFL